jgi:hypothetical protein
MLNVNINAIFPLVVRRVKQTHEDVKLVGHHDAGHAYRVATMAYEVAMMQRGDAIIARRAALAGLCHNADHVVVLKNKLDSRKEVPPEAVAAIVSEWIAGQDDRNGTDLIIEAVLKHGGKNDSQDSMIQVALMDADRIVNLSVDLLPRSGQNFPHLPVVDYVHLDKDPNATYRDPRSVWRDIMESLAWVTEGSGVCMRTKLGWELGNEYAEPFRGLTKLLEKQLIQQGMRPNPFGEQQ